MDKEIQVDSQDNMLNADASDMKELMPAMNVSVPAPKDDDNIISDEALVGIYGEIFKKIRDDRTEIDDFIAKFADMVFNEGDATTSSKEALVNLVKMKTDAADKMAKVAELMTRVKLKDPFPKYLAAHQNNTIHIEGNGAKRALLREINKAQKKKDKNE